MVARYKDVAKKNSESSSRRQGNSWMLFDRTMSRTECICTRRRVIVVVGAFAIFFLVEKEGGRSSAQWSEHSNGRLPATEMYLFS